VVFHPLLEQRLIVERHVDDSENRDGDPIRVSRPRSSHSGLNVDGFVDALEFYAKLYKLSGIEGLV